MSYTLREEIEESLSEHAEIEKRLYNRELKDRKIISRYCADNSKTDIERTLDLLDQYEGMPDHDRETVNTFRKMYPNELTIKIIEEFSDVQDIYSRYLMNGGDDNDY